MQKWESTEWVPTPLRDLVLILIFVNASHGQLCSRAHFNTVVAPSGADRATQPTGSGAPAPTATPVGARPVRRARTTCYPMGNRASTPTSTPAGAHRDRLVFHRMIIPQAAMCPQPLQHIQVTTRSRECAVVPGIVRVIPRERRVSVYKEAPGFRLGPRPRDPHPTDSCSFSRSHCNQAPSVSTQPERSSHSQPCTHAHFNKVTLPDPACTLRICFSSRLCPLSIVVRINIDNGAPAAS